MRYEDTDEASNFGCAMAIVGFVAAIAGSVACGYAFGAWAGWLFFAACCVVEMSLLGASYRKSKREYERSHREPR